MRSRWLSLGLILLVTVLAYGILIPQLGFYRDDWYLFLTAQSSGSAGIVALFQIDRPLIGYFYALGYGLLGQSPLAWQVAALVMRLAGNAAFLWLLWLLWPDRPTETLSAALLFSVYPGFTVEPNAGVYITDLTASAAAVLSFVLTLSAMRAGRGWVRIALAAGAGIFELFYLGMFESAIGLEIARLGLVWYETWRPNPAPLRATIIKALKTDVPYIILGLAFLVWRLFIFQSTRRATNLNVLVGKYSVLPVRSLLAVTVEWLKDIVETAVFAWIVPFYQSVATSNYRDLAIAVLLGLLAGAGTFFVLGQIGGAAGTRNQRGHDYQPLHVVLLGLGIVLFALLPIDLAGRNVLFADQWDRYTIYASAGVALLVAGFLFTYLDTRLRKASVAALVGMAVVVQYFSAAAYRDAWVWQRDLWQQMAWRAPGLQPGTMLFAVLPTGYEEGYELYGPANMVYYPGQGVVIGADVINPDTAANLELQKNREHYDRDVLVQDNYRDALIVAYPSPQSCLHVLDGRKIELPGLVDNSLVADVAQYSRIDTIETQAQQAHLPSFLMGAKPHAWCEYYQGMDLARQQGDWSRVVQLADEAQHKGLTPDDVSEWMPALEGYVAVGRMQDAKHAASIIRSSDPARAFLCLQMQRGAVYSAPYDYNEVNQILCQAG